MNNNVKQRLELMFTMQEQLNDVTANTDGTPRSWRDNDNPWYRAILMETSELIDQCGYKWWKHHEMNLGQAQLELVDIWHFGMSVLLQKQQNLKDFITSSFFSSILVRNFEDYHTRDFILYEGVNAKQHEHRQLRLESFMVTTLAEKKMFDTRGFCNLMWDLNMDFNTLYAMYIGKNALNHFRQTYGYNVGTYEKRWNGQEDNEHLMDILHELMIGGSGWYSLDLSERVLAKLQESYESRPRLGYTSTLRGRIANIMKRKNDNE